MAKILIVDDERSIRTTLSEFIKEDGHETLTATTADEAMSLVTESRPDVIITDIVLPRTTGMALLAQAHKVLPDTLVVMITGEPTVETAAAAVRDGAFDYLAKPISRDAIRSVVARATRHKSLADERKRLELENAHYRIHLEDEVLAKTQALQDSERKHRAVVDNAMEAVFVVQEGLIRFANPSASKLLGSFTPPHGAVPLLDTVHPDDRESVGDHYGVQKDPGEAHRTAQFRVIDPSGNSRWLDVRMVHMEWDGRPAWLTLARDATERRRIEDQEKLRRDRIQEQNAALVELAMDRTLYEGKPEAAFGLITETAARVLRVDRVSIWLYDETRSRIECADLYDRESAIHSSGTKLERTRYPAYFEALAGQRVISARNAHQDPRTGEFSDTYLAPLSILSLLDAPIRLGGNLVGVVCHETIGEERQWSHEDESFAASIATLASLSIEAAESARAEKALERSENEYRALFDDSPASLWHEDFSEVKRRVDSLMAEGVGDIQAYLESHPEFVDECISLVRIVDVNAAAIAMHRAGSKDDLLQGLPCLLTDVSRRSFAKQLVAISEGAWVFEDKTVDQTLAGDPIDVAIRWTIPPAYRETLERVLVSKIDITNSVHGERQLRAALGGTIEAIGLTTETRDPYTAGHMRRVTQLAVAIAERLDANAATIEGARAAGLMHDIGKMAVPAEILSKPSSLNEMEMALIQSHPQVAYDILKTVAFPWPVAEIVLQHHERLDGSGYPRGLGREEILLEARILSVSDVVEAMASHRPYRPAVGIEAALNEIEDGRGIRYDEAVVDACLRLFRESRFEFIEG